MPEKSKGMADKAEKDLDQASDCSWVRALDASGNPIRINKADFVELIRANMPEATSEKSGLMTPSIYNEILIYRGMLSDTNVDELKSTGMYYLTTGNTNIPIAYAHLIVFNFGDKVLQICTNDGIGPLLYRKYYHSSGWFNWCTIANL